MSKIGIIGAMELEVKALKEKMQKEEVIQRTGMEFCAGKLDGADVVIVQCGIGKVNAALCVQILVDHFHVTHIINTGVAGSLDSSLDIGDMVVSDYAVYHDMDVTALGYERGQVPQMQVKEFPAEKELAELAIKTCKEVNPDIQVMRGCVVSGDQFVSSREMKDNILKDFDGKCTEMEGAAIAHGAYLNEVPFVILRAISDKADDSAQMDYPTFEKAAAVHSARLVENMIRHI